MPLDLRGRLRAARYALPGHVETIARGPGPEAAARIAGRLHRRGLATTLGHFPGRADTAKSVLAANLAMIAALRDHPGNACLSVKAPQLGFARKSICAIAEAAAAARMSMMFDAHAPQHAEPTLALFAELLHILPETGCVLPARWRRSMADAERFRDSAARIRIVKGEWADPDWGERDVDANYLALVSRLAGRAGMVAVATHSPRLAERALAVLLAAGTPCELEQLRGLPMRRTLEIAQRLGVAVRVYVPFGLGWLPYALDKALARPYLLSWVIRDRLGMPDRPI